MLVGTLLCAVAVVVSQCLVGVSCHEAQGRPGLIQVDSSSNQFVDGYGRVRLFHGVNAVYKVPPWLPSTASFDPQLSLAAEDIDNLYNWGFNVVRLGVMWPGMEPTRGHYNVTYLSEVKSLVDSLGEKGIYTLADAHQDVFNRQFCGEGVPDWAVVDQQGTLPFPLPAAEEIAVDPKTGYPSIEDCLKHGFGLYYLSDKVGNSFQSLYDDQDGIQTSFAQFWQEVSSAFNTTDTILGYELFNEPWPGDIYRHPSLLKPGYADRHHLQPMYEKFNDYIRKVDDSHIIFFEQSLVDYVGKDGFTQGPGGESYNNRQAFSYHIYCAPVTSGGDPKNVVECDLIDDILYALSENTLKRLGVGGMMTEFGAMGNKSNAVQNLEALANTADDYLQSWSYWQFKLFQDITTAGPAESFYIEGQLETAKVKALSRTYATAIQGVPLSMKFTPSTSDFKLVYQLDGSIGAPTEIYLNEQFYYPQGFQVSLEPNGLATWKKVEQNRITVEAASPSSKGTVTVLITAQ